MTSLLIHRAHCIATMDDAQTELKDASLLIRDGRIERIIPASESTEALCEFFDLDHQPFKLARVGRAGKKKLSLRPHNARFCRVCWNL